MAKIWRIGGLAFVLAATAGNGGTPAGGAWEGERAWSLPGRHTLGGAHWEAGKATFANTKVALLAHDPTTDASVLYLELKTPAAAKEGVEPHHAHPSIAHTIVLEGKITSVVNGQPATMGAGDYFRSTPQTLHTATKGDATMLVITEGAFDTVPAERQQLGMGAGEGLKSRLLWHLPAMHQREHLQWEKGSGSLAGTEIAVVGVNPSTGATAMYVRLGRRDIDERLHYHTSVAHTVVLEGKIISEIDGQRHELGPGDYFRSTPGMFHSGSGVISDGALLFMLTDGRFDTVYADAEFDPSHWRQQRRAEKKTY